MERVCDQCGNRCGLEAKGKVSARKGVAQLESVWALTERVLAMMQRVWDTRKRVCMRNGCV